MRMFTWQNYQGYNHLSPMVWVSNFNQIGWDDRFDVQANLDYIVPLLEQQPESERCLFLYHAIEGAFRLVNSDPKKFFTLGPDTDQYRKFIIELFSALNEKDLKPGRIVLDVEHSFGFWQLNERESFFQTIFNDHDIYKRLPKYIRQYNPEDFNYSFYGGKTQAINDWNQFAGEERANALHDSVEMPLRFSFSGKQPPISNYQDMRHEWTMHDRNNWIIVKAHISEWASPSCYLSDHGWRYKDRSKAGEWNRFIDCMNYVRTNHAAHGTKVAPWITWHIGSEWLVDRLIKHMASEGVETFLWWEPRSDFERAQRVDELLSSLDNIKKQEIHTEIPLDSDVVDSGYVKTSYTEFSDAVLG